MTLRINNNIPALNTHRNLLENSGTLAKSLEKLSSGLRINKAADGPASLMISEQLRSQVIGLNQATENSEVAISMIQTTEAALSELTNTLTSLSRLAIHAANEGANSPETLAADHLEFTRSLDAIDNISKNAQFGARKLLDGSTGANGIAIGDGVRFLGAGATTETSPVEGYVVRITQLGRQASTEGTTALSQELIDAGETFSLSEGGKSVTFTTTAGDTASQVVNKLDNVISDAGLNINVRLTEDNTLHIQHKEYGVAKEFNYVSASDGVLSEVGGVVERKAGLDVQGTFDGDVATGEGRVLTGAIGTRAEELQVNYTGNTQTDDGETGEVAGRVAVFQNSLTFQVGGKVGQSETIALVNAGSRVLGRGIDNASNFQNLRDIDIRTLQGAEDAQRLVDVAQTEVNRNRAELGAFQKNSLEANLRQLRINAEELTNAESVIRDADYAKEISEYTRNNILVQSATAMLGQANQAPQNVLSLLG